jgi:DNA-binding response OmpR family regulator
MRTKLLIVEDNTELLELMRLGLKQAGFSISTATNGLDALKKARSIMPDLIVLDLILPELDGFAVCEALKRSPDTSAIPIILLTGLSGEFTRYAGIESGADEYVSKPISPEQLVPKIKSTLRAARTKANLAENKSNTPDPSLKPNTSSFFVK